MPFSRKDKARWLILVVLAGATVAAHLPGAQAEAAAALVGLFAGVLVRLGPPGA